MIELKVGQNVEIEYGGFARVIKVLGSGGQGIVYLVEQNSQFTGFQKKYRNEYQ